MLKEIAAAFSESAAEMKKVVTFTTCAMLGALSIILGIYSIQIGEFIKIDFANVPIQMGACMFGPVAGPIFGAVMDIINYFIKPTGPFFAGFTISAVVMTIIIGIALYKKEITLNRILTATFISTIIVDMGLNTIWLSIMYDRAIYLMLPMRILKCMILWPMQAGMMFVLLKALKRVKTAVFTRGNQ